MNTFKLSPSRRLYRLSRSLAAASPTARAVAAGARGGVRDRRTPDKIARGKYLVTIAGCNDCHTPLKMGPSTGPSRT